MKPLSCESSQESADLYDAALTACCESWKEIRDKSTVFSNDNQSQQQQQLIQDAQQQMPANQVILQQKVLQPVHASSAHS